MFNFTERSIFPYTKLVHGVMRLNSFYSIVLVTVVHAYIAEALFLNECPGKLMWNLRANNLCGALDKYMCLYDTNEGKFRELCKDAPEFHRPGNIFIISGNLQYFAGRPCKSDKYQPHKWWTNGSSDCQYLKSTCNEEGQVPYDNGTTSRDTKCRCDYTNYYTFVSSTRNKCFCDPTEEDCSCNRKKCYYDQVLTPDYDCVGIHAWTGQFVCPEYKAPKFTDKKTLQRRTTICPLIKQDFSGTVQQSSARIAHSSMLGVIIVLGLFTMVFVIIKAYIKRELKASGFKIRLLKNYDRIVKEIVPMEILSKMPFYVISEGDRRDVMDMVTQNKQARALLNILINSDKSTYNSFLSALRKDDVNKDLAKHIETTPVKANETVDDFNTLMEETVPLYTTGFYKIRLLKNYDRIVKEIVPMDILSKIPFYMIPEGDRCDIMDMVTQNQQTRALLNILISSDESIYNSFLVALMEDDFYEELAKDIETTPVKANETVDKFNTLMKESVPLNVRRRHDKLINDWREEIETKESETVLDLYSKIQTENVIAMIGTSGCEKSSDLHSVALMLLELDFEIIPCTKLSELIDYHNPYRCQMFLFEVGETEKEDFLIELNKESENIRSIQTRKGDKQKILISISCDTFWLKQKKKMYPEISFFVETSLTYHSNATDKFETTKL